MYICVKLFPLYSHHCFRVVEDRTALLGHYWTQNWTSQQLPLGWFSFWVTFFGWLAMSVSHFWTLLFLYLWLNVLLALNNCCPSFTLFQICLSQNCSLWIVCNLCNIKLFILYNLHCFRFAFREWGAWLLRADGTPLAVTQDCCLVVVEIIICFIESNSRFCMQFLF